MSLPPQYRKEMDAAWKVVEQQYSAKELVPDIECARVSVPPLLHL